MASKVTPGTNQRMQRFERNYGERLQCLEDAVRLCVQGFQGDLEMRIALNERLKVIEFGLCHLHESQDALSNQIMARIDQVIADTNNTIAARIDQVIADTNKTIAAIVQMILVNAGKIEPLQQESINHSQRLNNLENHLHASLQRFNALENAHRASMERLLLIETRMTAAEGREATAMQTMTQMQKSIAAIQQRIQRIEQQTLVQNKN